MDDQQVAFMTKQRVQRALTIRRLFHLGQDSGRFLADIVSLRAVQLAPLRAAKTEHLVQHAGAFNGNRDRRKLLADALEFHFAAGCHLDASDIVIVSLWARKIAPQRQYSHADSSSHTPQTRSHKKS